MTIYPCFKKYKNVLMQICPIYTSWMLDFQKGACVPLSLLLPHHVQLAVDPLLEVRDSLTCRSAHPCSLPPFHKTCTPPPRPAASLLAEISTTTTTTGSPPQNRQPSRSQYIKPATEMCHGVMRRVPVQHRPGEGTHHAFYTFSNSLLHSKKTLVESCDGW